MSDRNNDGVFEEQIVIKEKGANKDGGFEEKTTITNQSRIKGKRLLGDLNLIAVSIIVSSLILSGTLVYLFGSGTISPADNQQAKQNAAPSVLAKPGTAPDIGDSPVLGNKNAKVTIVEFSDYECPYCGKFYTETWPSIKSQYVDAGKVLFVYKDFPLSSLHSDAQKAAESARCVREQLGDKGYWAMHDKLFSGQSSFSVDNFKKWARSVGANGSKFDSCLDSNKYETAVKNEAAVGAKLGVRGTPTFFINDEMVVGAVPFTELSSKIDAKLAK